MTQEPDPRPTPAGEADPRPEPVTPADVSIDPAAVDPALTDGYYNDRGVPNYDAVRDKIEGRIGTSIGESELAEESDEGKKFQEQWDKREQAGKDRLEQLRKSLGGNN